MDEEISLVIYNTRGQKIRTLYKGMPASSNMNVNWDGKDESGESVSSGIYLYRLRGEVLVMLARCIKQIISNKQKES